MIAKRGKILLTGANGFLGKIIKKELELNYAVSKLGRSSSNDIICDLSTDVPVFSEIDFVIHCAGKAHVVPKNDREAQRFFEVNLEGTRNLLKALELQALLPQQFIFISTVAVYGRETGENIDEEHGLNGDTPYALSKIEAETLLIEWAKKFNVNLIIFRLPLIVGKNPPGNLGKMKQAISKGHYIQLANNYAKKSVVLAKDIGKFIPSVFGKNGTFNLTDGEDPSFAAIEAALILSMGKKTGISLPIMVVKWISYLGDIFHSLGIPFPLNSNGFKKLTSSLTFSDQKAREELDWRPNSAIEFIKEGL